MVAGGGYLGVKLYRSYLQLREENVHLIQKKKDSNDLKLAMKRIQKKEELIREVLGLEKLRSLEGVLSQGGMPVTDLSSIDLKVALANNNMRSIARIRPSSILDQAKFLQESLEELVEIIRKRRQLLDSTPSIVPVEAEDYWFSSGFGWRRSPFTALKEIHDGLDISAPKGTPIIAPAEGRVIKIAYQRYRGKYLQLDHGRRRITTYAHLSGFNVTLGQKVKRGEVIAYMGSTGRTTGSHLHYKIEINGRVVNPKHYILNAKANRVLETPLPAEGMAGAGKPLPF
jgi:murein DD-endopeptidase MepM/ murein hydrolase activator NlpD